MNPQRSSWFDEVRQSAPHVLEVAEAVGLTVRRNRFGPCPCCRRDDPRHPPLTVRHGGAGWMCAACKEHGDAVRLVSWVVTGGPKPPPQGWDVVRAAFASRGWCAPGDNAAGWTPPPAREAPAPEPYPDPGELAGLLRACRRVEETPEVAEWCRGRGWTVPVPAAVLPDVTRWPSWWPFRGRPWRLVVSMVDAAGTIRSMHARATEELPPDRDGKTRWPFERRATGLLFADPGVGRRMLRGEIQPRRVLVVEGMTDYLAACAWQRAGRHEDTAVLGATSGGFAALAMAGVPRDATVGVATDADAAGDRYATEVVAALAPRDVRRIRFGGPRG